MGLQTIFKPCGGLQQIEKNKGATLHQDHIQSLNTLQPQTANTHRKGYTLSADPLKPTAESLHNQHSLPYTTPIDLLR